MSNLIAARSGLSGLSQTREERSFSRQLANIDRGRAVGIAQLEAKAQVEAARIHAVGYIGQQALQAVAMVSQMEGQLGMICPMAVSRLQGIADITALSVAQVVSEAHRRLS